MDKADMDVIFTHLLTQSFHISSKCKLQLYFQFLFFSSISLSIIFSIYFGMIYMYKYRDEEVPVNKYHIRIGIAGGK